MGHAYHLKMFLKRAKCFHSSHCVVCDYALNGQPRYTVVHSDL